MKTDATAPAPGELHPADIADELQRLAPDEAVARLRALPPETASEVLAELETDAAQNVVARLSGRACTIVGCDVAPLVAALTAEVVLTFMFLMIILGATDKRAPAGFAPIAIGLGLTLIHLIGIPVTNLSVNPARSTGPAVFVGGWALAQLWLFWVAPIIGAACAGIVYRACFDAESGKR